MTVNTAEVLAKVPTGLLIDGQWVDSVSNETLDVTNPATGETLATLASASEEDARRALDAAAGVQAKWAKTPARERAEILRRAFELVTERREEFATLMTLEMGKPLSEARGEVDYGAEYLRWFSEETARQYGNAFRSPDGTTNIITRRKPVGPCLLITPWNFPLAMATRKVAPAVAAGCTMVLKSAKLTPLTAQYFAQTMMDAGLPAGVLNVVTGKSASAISGPVMSDSRLRKVSFTGSTSVGKTLLKQAADNVLRTSMELGGNAPFLVFEDADLDQAVDGLMAAKMRNMGEACTAANRVIVHEDVAEEFIEKAAAKLKEFTVGNGMDESVTCGPLIEESAVENLVALVADAKDKGAEVVVGGNRLEGDGFFFEPTLITGVTAEMRVVKEEIFGPVIAIQTFSTEDEALSMANDTEYGLGSYAFTEDSDRLWRVADGLEFGLFGANVGAFSNAAAPFGGVKHSGMGREGGAEGLDEYTEVQYMCVRNPY